MSEPAITTTDSPLPLASTERMTNVRWVMLALIFFGTTVNYIDRQVMGLLAGDLQKMYSISDAQYGYINLAFGLAYAVGQLISGGLLDKFGIRIVYAFALVGWSISAMLTALGRGPWSFGICRSLLGFSESPAYPAAARTCAEWFPRQKRAFAFGFVNAGCNMAVIVSPFLVAWLTYLFNWEAAFIVTGALGFVVLMAWLPLYHPPHKHPSVSQSELDLINSDPPEPTTKIRWVTLFRYKETWAFCAGKFITDPMWWFFIAWIPKYLQNNYQLNLFASILPLLSIYLMADVGSIAGGWLSSTLIHRGYSVNAARKIALAASACCALPIIFAQNVSSLWGAVIILGFATAAHQGFSSNLYTTVSDMFPKRAVASVAGLGGSMGWIGASIFQAFVGNWVQFTHNYWGPFICAGLAYFGAFGVVHLLSPRLQPAKVDGTSA